MCLLTQNFLLHDNLTSVIQLSVKPKSSVRKVKFACGRALSKTWSIQLIVSSSFVSSCFRNFAFRMCHLYAILD